MQILLEGSPTNVNVDELWSDIAAVVTYERNAWGNNKGDMVTPKEVLELKQAESK